MKKALPLVIDLQYLVKFLFLFAFFFYLNTLVIGITSPGGRFYSGFIDQNLNYVSWLRASILKSSNVIAHMAGLDSKIMDEFTLGSNGFNIRIVYSCLGLGIMSFWTAFILVDSVPARQKIQWLLTGLLMIWFINCLRMVVLLAFIRKHVSPLPSMDHHTVFNIISYLLILALMYFYYRKIKKNVPVALS